MSFKLNDAFECIKVYVPKGTSAILKAKAAERGEPVSRLCAIAIDNELDQKDKAFRYPTELPKEDTENEYTVEGGKILQFLRKFPSGLALDTLLLCRRDIGLTHRDTVLAAYKELLQVGLIEEFKPPRAAYYHNPNYMRVRIVDERPGKKDKRRTSVDDLEKRYNNEDAD